MLVCVVKIMFAVLRRWEKEIMALSLEHNREIAQKISSEVKQGRITASTRCANTIHSQLVFIAGFGP